MTHEVTVTNDCGRRKWVCTCGWRGETYVYDDPGKPVEAIRHALEANRQET